VVRLHWAFLDEATRALDLESEKLVMSLLRSELPDTTFVIVAHREPAGLGKVRNVPLGVGWCSTWGDEVLATAC
jgi:putative ATP-binding cassette transporter